MAGLSGSPGYHRENVFQKWLVFFSRFMVMFFLTGSVKVGGILFTTVSSGNASGTLTGFILILPYAVGRLCGPISSTLLTYGSFRQIGTIGGILVGAGFILIGLFAESAFLHAVFSVIAGIGFSCLLLPASMCLKEHFKEDYPAVMPLSMMGSYIGITVIPPIMEVCRYAYGDKGTYLIFGALCWNLIPCGLLLRSPSSSITEAEDYQLLHEMKSSNDEDENEQDDDEKEQEGDVMAREKTDNSFHSLIRNKYAKAAYLGIKEQMSVFRSGYFCLFFFVANMRKIPADGWTLFLIPHLIKRGLTSFQAAEVASVGGMMGVFGRVIACFSFKTKISPFLLYGLYYILNGLAFFMMEAFPRMAKGFVSQFFGSALNGCLLSIQSGMTPGVLVFITEPHHYKTAYGILDFGNGLLTLVAGAVPGIFLDVTGDFTLAFYLFGIISTVDGLLVFILWIILERKKKRAASL